MGTYVPKHRCTVMLKNTLARFIAQTNQPAFKSTPKSVLYHIPMNIICQELIKEQPSQQLILLLFLYAVPKPPINLRTLVWSEAMPSLIIQ